MNSVIVMNLRLSSCNTLSGYDVSIYTRSANARQYLLYCCCALSCVVQVDT